MIFQAFKLNLQTMNTRLSYIPLAQQKFANFSTTSCVCTKKPNHYDSLGITPKATQADVKSAYYELSKVYHPDRNEGCEVASQKFRDITEAYEVLGNVSSRKLYDKGMTIGTSLGQRTRRESPEHRFYESRETKTRPSASGGRQPIYDFDQWSKAHYGATFARDMANKRRQHILRQREIELKQGEKMERVLLVVGLVVAFCMYVLYDTVDYDDVVATKSFERRDK